MKRLFLLAIAALACCAAVGAWQGVLSTLALTQKQVQDSMLTLDLPYLSGAGRMAVKAMTPEQRAATAREVGGVIKTLVTSAAFQKLYAEYIKTQHYAVDHGIKVETPGAVNDVDRQMAAAKQAMAVQMGMMMLTFPIDAAKAAFAEKQQNWAETLKDKTADPEERARAQKMQARAKTMAPAMQSSPEAFVKGLAVLTSVELGGPETEEALRAANAGSENQQKMQQEQQAWNKYNLKTVLRAKLTDFVKVADSVDFAAQTKDVGGRKVFVNPAYERSNGMWKAMFRAGKLPTTAGADVARAWLKEL